MTSTEYLFPDVNEFLCDENMGIQASMYRKNTVIYFNKVQKTLWCELFLDFIFNLLEVILLQALQKRLLLQ